MKREGMLNIIPYDMPEDEIEKYVSYLKGDSVRYGEIWLLYVKIYVWKQYLSE